MKDIGAVINDMAPPKATGAHAEIILFTIAARESLRIQHTDLFDAFTAHIHAEAVASRYRRIKTTAGTTDASGKGYLVNPLW